MATTASPISSVQLKPYYSVHSMATTASRISSDPQPTPYYCPQPAHRLIYSQHIVANTVLLSTAGTPPDHSRHRTTVHNAAHRLIHSQLVVHIATSLQTLHSQHRTTVLLSVLLSAAGTSQPTSNTVLGVSGAAGAQGAREPDTAASWPRRSVLLQLTP